MTERLHNTKQNLPPGVSQRDEFSIIRRRAQQASNFYNSVGLSNGDLPRDVSPRETAFWPGSPEKKRTLDDITKPSVVLSQPSTPSATTSKYGATWLEPSKSISNVVADIKTDEAGSHYNALPNKFVPERSYKSVPPHYRSKSSSIQDKATLLSPRNFHDSARFPEASDVHPREPAHTRKLSYENSMSNPVSSYNSLPRFQEQKVEAVDSVFAKEDTNHHRSNGLDSEAPRVSSHLYEKQLPNTPERKPKAKPFQSEQLTPVIFGKKTTASSRKTSDNDVKPALQTNSHTSSNYSASDSPSSFERRRSRSDAHRKRGTEQPVESSLYRPDRHKSPTSHLMNAHAGYGSSSSLNESKELTDGQMGGMIQEYRKNKSCQSSPVIKHTRKIKTDTSPEADSARASPKPRRGRGKKSKSDVPDHRVIIDRLQAIQNEKEAREHSILSNSDRFELGRQHRHNFSHYDWQSMLFSFRDTLVGMETLKRKNTPSGASKAAAMAAAVSTDSLASKGSSTGSQEDVSAYPDDEESLENKRFNALVASCPYFYNEIGGESDRVICISASSGLSVQVGNRHNETITEAKNVLTNHTYLSVVEGDQSESLMPPNSPARGSVSFGIENVDNGAYYYRTHFYERDHQNYFGIDEKYGPLVISFRREKIDEKGVYQYRIVVRTCELRTLRGSILEDAILLGRHAPSKGHPAKDILEYLCPEFNSSCLKLGLPTPKAHEQIMRIDEQNVNNSYKVGVLYCKAGQTTEEDMYNNEHGGEAFKQFLDLLGRKVVLNGFDDFKGGLDVKTDSTGTESVFTTFNGYKIMFHVSTLLPYTPNNLQQLLRKRHIGNDIVTIVFQEPGSEPFNPRHIRSHFQHVFIVVRVHNPCSDDTCYSVAVTRSRNIPRFGPAIPPNSMFPLSPTFRDFLLTKVINGENTAHSAGKFKSLAMNTREQYLRDLALNYVAQGSVESSQRLGRFSIHAASRKIKENKDKQKSKPLPVLLSRGCLMWNVLAHDYTQSQSIACLLGISDCALLVVELSSRQLIFSIPCQAVLGWAVPPATHEQLMTHKRDLHIYYGRGEKVSVETDCPEARDEIVLRLEYFTKGIKTVYRHLRRNKLGELGFRVNYEGIVVELKPEGYAAQDGLKQSSRLVEICKIAVATLIHDEINDLLRTSTVVTVMIIPPNEDGTPKKCSMDLYHLYPVLQVKRVNLQAPPCDVSHERSQSEPVHVERHSDQVDSARRASGDANYHVTETDSFGSHHPRAGSIDSPAKVKMQKPILSKTESGNHTTATLIASASRHALVGDTAGYHQDKDSQENGGDEQECDSLHHCKPRPSFLSHQVESAWTEGYLNSNSLSNTSLSSDSGLNSNNNSSYSSTLSRCSNNHPPNNSLPVNFNEILGSKFMEQTNQNNNNNNNRPLPPEARSTLPRSNPPIRGVVWNSNRTLPKPIKEGDSSYFQERSSTNPLRSSGKKPVPVPRSHKKVPVPSPRISHSQNSKHKRVVTDVPPSPSLTQNLKTSSSSNLSSSWSPSDVHSSLLRMIGSEKLKKNVPLFSASRVTPGRAPSQRRSPPRKNLFSKSLSPPLLRTVSDESLCGARTDEVSATRHESATSRDLTGDDQSRFLSASVDSLSPLCRNSSRSPRESTIRKLTSFPLPAAHKWDEILDAATAAERFDFLSQRSASVGTLDESPNSSDRVRPVKREARLMRSASRDSDNIPDAEEAVSRSMMGSRSEAEERLERIERKLMLLQDQLKKEQKSKKFLQKEVTSLRRDNTFLLHHVVANELNLNGSGKKKHSVEN